MFLRSSLNTIHGDKYNELARSQSYGKNDLNTYNRVGMGGGNGSNNIANEYSKFANNSNLLAQNSKASNRY